MGDSVLRSVSWAQAGLALAVVFATFFGSFAGPASAQANPRYAALVVDARSGEVLFSRNANEARFPASLTKVMTLYVLFEEMEAGRISMDTQMRVSAHAQAQPPSELGLRSGQSIAARDAILALVTKSANDVAAVVAEHISGSEQAFARRMTDTARRIGMSSTTFRNASGLPNSEQRTTANDMVLMGRAIQQRFPQRYQVFSTQSFRYAGRTYRNHNRLLGNVRGVDGIKTGYTRASGFNLLSSVTDQGRHVVAVVMGGRSGATRDAHMRELLATHLRRASTGPRSAPLIVSRAPFSAPSPVPHPAGVARVAGAPALALVPQLPQVGSQPLPNPVPPSLASAQVEVASLSQAASAEMVATHSSAQITTASAPAGFRLGAAPTDGWTIQIGAMPSQEAAVRLLTQAHGEVSHLASRMPYTQAVQSNGTTLWRARFGGFSEREVAQAACSALEARSYACLAVRPER
jgi:D-alanyl-D-alanine carboxypeptidase